MNLTYINSLQKQQAGKLSAYELSQLMQHKLLFSLCNFSVKEVEQLQGILQAYKNEMLTRNGIPPEPAIVEHRVEMVQAQCQLGNCNAGE